MDELKMWGKIVIKGTIETCTGLHIGGSPAGLNIGGVDKPVIKDHEGKPYIPGSSLKGKMRSLLEKSEGLVTSSSLVQFEAIRMHMCDSPECPVCRIFGRTNGDKKRADGTVFKITSAKVPLLIVRDAYLIPASIPQSVKDNIDLEWTEVKFENSIDRITSAANPRQSERVPRGARFDFHMIYTVYSSGDRNDFVKVTKAMRLLEDDYLGGSGTRGYGQVCFKALKLYWNTVEDYETGNVNLEEKAPEIEAGNLSLFIEKLNGPDGLDTLDGRWGDKE